MLQWMPVMKYGAFLGLGLLITDVIWSITASRDLQKENATLTHEVNTLKAKIFDLQETTKKSSPSA
jgi:cell division protein FtsB